jgi:L-ascorbate metabolism protein UlaG (beta-lactamase superfamily)
MSTALTFWGATAFEIVSPTHRIVVDPHLEGNPVAPLRLDEVEPPDLILVSHSAFEYPRDIAPLAKRTGSVVLCGADVRERLIDQGVDAEQVQSTTWGVVTEVAGLAVRPVEAQRRSISKLSNGQTVSGIPLGFIVETEPGVRIYYYGETSYFDMRWMGELYEPTVAILGCSQTRPLVDRLPGPGRFVTSELSADEAARVAELLGVKVAVGCHYFTTDADVDAFVDLVTKYDSTGLRRAIGPSAGDTIVVDADGLVDVTR